MQNYTFIEQQITNNSLHSILKIVENGINKNICYSYNNFATKCKNILKTLGFNFKHKGFLYIIDCAYNIVLEHTNNLTNIYKNIAIKNSVSQISVEKAIRSCKNAALKSAYAGEITQININNSNKKFIKQLNCYVVNRLL